MSDLFRPSKTSAIKRYRTPNGGTIVLSGRFRFFDSKAIGYEDPKDWILEAEFVDAEIHD